MCYITSARRPFTREFSFFCWMKIMIIIFGIVIKSWIFLHFFIRNIQYSCFNGDNSGWWQMQRFILSVLKTLQFNFSILRSFGVHANSFEDILQMWQINDNLKSRNSFVLFRSFFLHLFSIVYCSKATPSTRRRGNSKKRKYRNINDNNKWKPVELCLALTIW